jgi:anti-sigma regulatory factor (Ser/Thr protein kinase)
MAEIVNEATIVPLIFAVALILLLAGASVWGRRQTIVLRVPARLESIRPLLALAGQFARKARLDDQDAFYCQLALDEACINIIEHAYPDNMPGEIEAEINVGDGIFVISLIDFGRSYDPSQVSPPPLKVTLDEVEPGGLGLHLMRTVMDEVRYIPGPRCNQLVMVKRSHSYGI